MTAFDRDSAAADALRTDHYLDALLAGPRDGAAMDATGAPPALDPATRRAADRLRHDLVRVHPSFRFEERLAMRLAAAAVDERVPLAVGAEGRLVSFRAGPTTDLAAELLTGVRVASDPFSLIAEPDAARRVPARPILIGGALTSAALSIAGAAFVAWRLGRPGRRSTPMARAARAVRGARLAGAVASAGARGATHSGTLTGERLLDPQRPRRVH